LKERKVGGACLFAQVSARKTMQLLLKTWLWGANLGQPSSGWLWMMIQETSTTWFV
jgi:hypothetical protein